MIPKGFLLGFYIDSCRPHKSRLPFKDPGSIRMPIGTFHMDLYWEDRCKDSKGIDRRIPFAGILKPVFKDEAKRLLKYEHLVYDYFDQHSIISEEERLLIYHQKREKITVVSNGIDTAFFTPQKKNKEYDIIFVNTLNYIFIKKMLEN